MTVIALDPLIAEAKQRARRRRLIALLLGLLVAVAATVTVVAAHRGARDSASPRSGPAAQMYEVTTNVAYRGGTDHPLACKFSALMTGEPGGGCTGVPLTGYDFGGIPRVEGYRDGGWATQALRLIGTWDGHLFHVTSAMPVANGEGVEPAEPERQEEGQGELVGR